MNTIPAPTFAQLIQRYFCDYLIDGRNLSNRTIESYRDAFKLLLSFFEQYLNIPIPDLSLRDLNANNVSQFLSHLEHDRKNSVQTRNVRFAAIRSFIHYAARQVPTYLSEAQAVLAMPMKKSNRSLLGYLSKKEIQALLAAPDLSTWSGRRDRAMFTVLYNSGARVSELISLTVQDLQLDGTPWIQIQGKGRKERTVPLWRSTAKILKAWLKEIETNPQSPLFPNRSGMTLTRSGVESRLKRAVHSTETLCSSLKKKTISPHIFRHSTAMHLLQSGIDITVIALWLGHESITTTHSYVQADLKMKEDALAKLAQPGCKRVSMKRSDKLLRFLESL